MNKLKVICDVDIEVDDRRVCRVVVHRCDAEGGYLDWNQYEQAGAGAKHLLRQGRKMQDLLVEAQS